MRSGAFKRAPMIDAEAASVSDDAMSMAELLIVQEQGPDAHFTAAARNLARALILFNRSTKED